LKQHNGEKERLFIYYSGHGFTDYNGASQRNAGYITGSDTPVYKLKDDNVTANALPFYDIDSWNRQTKARHVLMVFDSCFSGSLLESKGIESHRLDQASIRQMLKASTRYYITAGRDNEEVAADGTFAKLLLKGISGGADLFKEGIISAEDLGIFLFHIVHKYSDRQTPQFGSIAVPTLSEGQFFFVPEAVHNH
jgi:uncharacterized caspase-like protein